MTFSEFQPLQTYNHIINAIDGIVNIAHDQIFEKLTTQLFDNEVIGNSRKIEDHHS